MPVKEMKSVPIADVYRKRCGNITFVVSSFGNPDTKNTADDLLLSILRNKAKERMAV